MTGGVYKWALVGLLWMVALLNYLDRQVVFSLFPPIQAEFQIGDVQLGLLSTAFLWVYGLFSPAAGWLADRFSRRSVILSSLGVWSLVTWATGHARSYGELLTTRALMGISEACYLPAALALIADHHDKRTRSRATGLHQSGLYAGIVLGGAGGGWLGQQYGWRTAFLALGVTGVIYAAVLAGCLKNAPAAGKGPEANDGWRAGRALFASPAFLLLTAVNALASVAYWVVYTWLPLYLYERFHLSLAGAGFSATFYLQAASATGILVGGWLADRWSRTNPQGRVFTQAIGLLAAGPFLFLAGSAGTIQPALAGLILFGLGRGLFDCNLMPVLCQMAPARLRATGYGIFNLTSCLAGGAMAALAGALKSSMGLGGGLQISAVMLVAAGLLLLRLRLPDA